MQVPLRTLLTHLAASTRARVIFVYALLLAFNLAVWLWALTVFHAYPVLLGTAFLAYSFGLRHAVDADHIAAIDNVTRKLMQEGKRPVGVGLMFSLGHSTIVVLGSVLLAVSARAFTGHFESIRAVGGVIGTLISALFLCGIAAVNLIVLRSVYRVFVRVRRGEPYVEEDLNLLMAGSGFFARLFRPLFAAIRNSWHMYPLGVLFGLGFDTATEVGLLAISATEASKGLPLWSILVFPALFAAGMSLIDTTDNVLMLGAYSWAFIKPVRKLYYNMTITCVSILVAFAIGGIELLGLFSGMLHAGGKFWNLVDEVNAHFGMIGYLIIGLFVASWAVSVAIYKWRRFDHVEVKT